MIEKMPLLLAVSEIGGYPNFTPLYEKLGYQVITETSMRKVLKLLKKKTPQLVVAEFNYQSDFRDRTSSLESMMSVIQRNSLHSPETKVIIFYDKEHKDQLARLEARYTLAKTLAFPILEVDLEQAIVEL
ncbi:MAG: hypothetical protein KAI17_22770 [Thiotrichaceae bacterium]|nr:hypothetical protein [Thiotrichaceae bacterium]